MSSFAPDIRVIPADKSLVAGFTAFSKVKWGTFGPPVFLATQAAMNAALNACAASGKAGTLRVPPQNGTATRAEVTHWMHKTLIRNSILGGTLSFTPKGDARGAKSYIFQIQDNGDYKLVG